MKTDEKKPEPKNEVKPKHRLRTGIRAGALNAYLKLKGQ
jgi:hypothetical protein